MERNIISPTQIILFCIFFIFLVSNFSPATSGEVEDESEFDYIRGSEQGPDRWGEIESEWGLCKNGTMQSPIDLLDHRVIVVSPFDKLQTNYKPSNATLINRGHDMMLKWKSGEAGYIEMSGTQYMLQQCHWHSPSEHTIGGKSFDLELHVVHESLDGQILVIGIMYRIGEPDPFLASMEERLYETSDSEKQTIVGDVDPKRLKVASRRYYRYIGSLTVPPCSQNVVWIVVKEARTVSKKQVSLLRVAVHDDSDSNARPIQQVHGRSVNLFTNDEVNEDQD